MGRSLVNEPLTLTRCHSFGLPQIYEALEGWKSVYSLQCKGHKGGNFCFSYVSSVLILFYCSSFHGMMCADRTVAGRGNVLINK